MSESTVQIRPGTDAERKDLLIRFPGTRAVLGEGGCLLLAKAAGETVGFLWAFRRAVPVPPETLAADDAEWFINVVEVFDSAWRCRGVASALVQALLQRARADGAYQVRAYCDASNLPSHRLWRKNRFAICPVKLPDGSIPGSFVSYVL